MSNYGPDDPLRLDVAVEEAFPAGGMTVSGLRKEISKGRLEVEVIAGKLFTTLNAIAKMRERCRRPMTEQWKPGERPTQPQLEAAQQSLLDRIATDKEKLTPEKKSSRNRFRTNSGTSKK